MAFPLPIHLPRKKDVRDISTQILTKVSETPLKALNAKLASSWVAELNDTIRSTKTQIHDRISSDLPDFERQFATAVSAQERLRSLSQNVDVISDSISNPQSGLIPNLVDSLTSHARVVQETSDARAQHCVLSHLLQCRNELRRLTRLVEKAELADATTACSSLEDMFAGAPEALSKSNIMADMKRKCTSLRSRTQEQLLDAYSRSIVVSASEISVKPSVQAVLPRRLINGVWVQSMVPGDNIDTIIQLPALLASISPATLSTQLSTLRRDITTHYIEYVLKQPVQIYNTKAHDITGIQEYKLSLQRGPPGSEDPILRLSHLTTVMSFLSEHLFPSLPPTERKSFLLSLSTPLRTALLNLLLLPNLPSSPSQLPAFLRLTQSAVQAEEEIIVKMLGDTSPDRSIKVWVDGVGLHYERKRRADILDRARAIAVTLADDGTAFRAEMTPGIEDKSVPVQVDDELTAVNGQAKEPVAIEPEDSSAWDFEDNTPGRDKAPAADEWGLDDDIEPEPEPEPEPVVEPPKPPEPEPTADTEEPAEEEDDPWAWNNDNDAEPADVEDDSAWDNAWDEKPAVPPPEPAQTSPISAPRQAKGLEKRFGGKSVPQSPAPPPPPASAPAPPPQPVAAASKHNPPAPPPSKPMQVAESYVVSRKARELLQLVEDVLREGAELVASGILKPTTLGSPGSIIVQAAPMALELFRALVPITNAALLKQSAKEPMRFSNDCLYVGTELGRIVAALGGTERDKLEEGRERLRVLADSWFEDAVTREERLIDEVLDSARGFIDTTQQERYDECEEAVNDVLQRIRRVAPQWKAVLAKSRYYDALGSIVEAALSRILADMLALEDITETESHRLSELCHILNALEGQFVEDPDQPSFVVSYVPSWLKFSYLSELLEASIADISYLFEEGALVDFEIEELVKLVKALFADTQLRANTIGKLQQGHPVR